MATQSHNKKKPTKKQIQQNIVNHYENSLKENFIKNMVMGFEVASQMYLDKIESGCTIDELKEFIKKNIENESIMESVATRKTVNEQWGQALMNLYINFMMSVKGDTRDY